VWCGGQGARWGELLLKVVGDELEEAFGAVEATQSVEAKVHEGHSVDEVEGSAGGCR